MAKRMEEQKEEERIVAKSKSTAINLSSHVPTSSFSRKSPIASESLEMLIATGKAESRTTRNSKSDAASSSQARLQRGNLSQQKRSQGMWTFPNLKPGVFMKKK